MSKEADEWHTREVIPVAHAHGMFAEVKYDHECEQWGSESGCASGWEYPPYCDEMITQEIGTYGMSGVPAAWRREWESIQGAVTHPKGFS